MKKKRNNAYNLDMLYHGSMQSLISRTKKVPIEYGTMTVIVLTYRRRLMQKDTKMLLGALHVMSTNKV